MSKIDELISKYCPNGVVYRKVSDVAKVSIGEFVHKNNQNPDGLYPVYNGGTSNTGYYDEFNNTANKIIISARGANAGFVNKVLVDYWAGNSCYTIDVVSDELDWNFVYYFLKNSEKSLIGQQQTGSIPAVSKKQIETFKIPLPPLSVQQEIVRILDGFSELEKELEKELETREKQYEYYRNQLLSFGEGGERTHNVKWAKLGDVAEIYDGTHTTPHYTESGIKFVSVENINDLYATTKYISTEDYNKYKTKPRINDVFMTRIGSIGSCAIVDKNEDLAYYVSLALIRPNTEQILSKYIKYIIESKTGKKELAKRTLMTAVPIKINLSEIGKIQIPIPPLPEQERIVTILDKFDALVNDISVGLPAEIDARRKQYEYYREKLLTFPMVGCDA